MSSQRETSSARPMSGLYAAISSPFDPRYNVEPRRASANAGDRSNSFLGFSTNTNNRRHSAHPHPSQNPRSHKPSNQPRDSVIEPDTCATFTSPNAATAQPPLYPSKFPPPLKVTRYAVHDATTNEARITIIKNAVHMPEPFSSKPLLTLTNSATGAAFGTIRFHTLSSGVDLELSGVGSSRMSHEGHFSKRWKFASLLGDVKTELCWFDSKKDGWELRVGGKKGEVIARIGAIESSTLKFEKVGMDEREIDEVILSAVAVFEAARRSRRDLDWSGTVQGVGAALGSA